MKSRETPIEKRFQAGENPNKKRYIFECQIKMENVKYLEKLSNRRGESRSAIMEWIILSTLLFNPQTPLRLYCIEGKAIKNIYGKNKKKTKKYKKIPKFTIHPRYSSLLRGEKERRGVSYTVLIDEIFLDYRSRFP